MPELVLSKDLLPIDLPSCPAIANTAVVRSPGTNHTINGGRSPLKTFAAADRISSKSFY